MAAKSTPYSHYLGIFGTIIVLIAAISMVVAYAKTSIAKTTIELQESQIKAQSERIIFLEKTNTECEITGRERELIYKNKSEEFEFRINDLQKKLDIVQQLKSGEEAVNKLEQRLAAVLQTNNENIEKILGLLQGL